MKLLFDLFPVLLFFLTYKLSAIHPEAAAHLGTQWLGWMVSGGTIGTREAGILWATLVTISATFLQVAYLLIRGRRIEPMLWISLAIVSIFGGATIWLHNEVFIKWKPTVLYWFFATALLFAHVVLKRNLVRRLLGTQITLPEKTWSHMLVGWVAFFLLMGGLNVYVAHHYSTNVWVDFKLFGLTGCTLAFIVLQALLISRHAQQD